MTRNKAIFYLSAIFVVGLLAGGMAGFSLGRRPLHRPPRPEQMVEQIRSRLRADLDLTDEQVRKLDPLLQDFASNLRSFHHEAFERMQICSRQLDQRIEEFLTPQQKEKLHQIQKEREEKFRKFSEPKPKE